MSTSKARCLLDIDGAILLAENPDLELPTASLGKVFVLCEAAEQLCDGRLDPEALITRDQTLQVADSGLWQHLTQTSLPAIDLCVLIASVSDNWATNMMLDHLGLDAIADRAALLGCTRSRLHDRVRDQRRPDDPPSLSTGTARELAEVARRIHLSAQGADALGLSSTAALHVEQWLRTNVDLSLVAAAMHLDPLAHVEAHPRVWNKTGWDPGVRAEMGLASGSESTVAYAAIGRWDAPEPGQDDVLTFLNDTGTVLQGMLTPEP